LPIREYDVAMSDDDLCLSCGRHTSAGTALFADRKRGRDVENGAEGYLCAACQPGSAQVTADQSIPLSGRYVVIEFGGSGGPPGV
jgi:hypothetical protein